MLFREAVRADLPAILAMLVDEIQKTASALFCQQANFGNHLPVLNFKGGKYSPALQQDTNLTFV